MLNYVWLALIVLGILTAAGRDVYDLAENSYGNNIPWKLQLAEGSIYGTGKNVLHVKIAPDEIRRHFRNVVEARDTSLFSAMLVLNTATSGTAVISLTESSQPVFITMADALGTKGTLSGRCALRSGGALELELQPVQFVYLRKVTNAVFDAAGTAVQIAIGLIGIMALWLGMMKIAEEAGLITLLARIVKPVTIRLFPDVPHDHPAVGSIIMNIAANMLGLGNAATPFGLKAMEQLNEINPNAGTASNAMCTFLALNTSCITLIPASAIAIRAALGAANPAIIIGTTFLASLCATIFALIAAKTLERTRWFRLKEPA